MSGCAYADEQLAVGSSASWSASAKSTAVALRSAGTMIITPTGRASPCDAPQPSVRRYHSRNHSAARRAARNSEGISRRCDLSARSGMCFVVLNDRGPAEVPALRRRPPSDRSSRGSSW